MEAKEKLSGARETYKERFQAAVIEAFQERRELGLVPLEGQWLSTEEAKREAMRQRRKRIVAYFEILALCVLLVLSAGIIISVLRLIVY